MIKIIEVKESLKDSTLLNETYKTELLIKDIVSKLENSKELNIDDYVFIKTVLNKTKIALQKVNNILIWKKGKTDEFVTWKVRGI